MTPSLSLPTRLLVRLGWSLPGNCRPAALLLLLMVSVCLAEAAELPLPPAAGGHRETAAFTSTEGQVIEAVLLRFDAGSVLIRRGGKDFTVPHSRLNPDSVTEARVLAQRVAVSPDGTTLSAWHQRFNPEAFRLHPAAVAKLDRESLDLNLLSAAIWHATNEARMSRGVPVLRFSAALRSSALGHAQAMSDGGFFSHDNPGDAAERTMVLRMAAAGVAATAAAENISSMGAASYSYAAYGAAVVNQWLNSPGHRANLLSSQYRFIGCAAYPCRCPQFHLLAVQNFAAEVPPSADEAAPLWNALAPPPPPPPPGQARLTGGLVTAPGGIPEAVGQAIAAGNVLQTKSYKYGGGRDTLEDSGYDCSGAVSYVLIKAGLLDAPLTSAAFLTYGEPGPGRWITIHAKAGHVFMTICGVRLDTGGRAGRGASGPRWRSQARSAAGWTVRHPTGF
jgi:uncharacterized protein YkwD